MTIILLAMFAWLIGTVIAAVVVSFVEHVSAIHDRRARERVMTTYYDRY